MKAVEPNMDTLKEILHYCNRQGFQLLASNSNPAAQELAKKVCDFTGLSVNELTNLQWTNDGCIQSYRRKLLVTHRLEAFKATPKLASQLKP